MTCCKKKAIRRLLIVFIAAIFIALGSIVLMRDRNFAAAEEGAPTYAATVETGETVQNYSDFAEAWTAANGSADSVLSLSADVTTQDTLTVAAGAKFTLDLNDKKLAYDNSVDLASVITVNGELTLVDNAEVKTEKRIGDNPDNKITGGYITGGTGSSYGMIGGGVRVRGGGKLLMESGNISGNSASAGGWGGGVYIDGGGMFEMIGGEISYNSAVKDSSYGAAGGGGGVAAYGASGTDAVFTMKGGTIRNNTATSTSVGGGGILVSSAQVTIGGDALITKNSTDYRGGGVCLHGGCTFEINGGVISDNMSSGYGGGIYAEASDGKDIIFDLYGGEIKGNISNNMVGGICFLGKTLNIKGAPYVAENTAGGNARNIHLGAIDGTRPMKVTGPLTDGTKTARLHVYHGAGDIAESFSTHNPTLAPSEVFVCDVSSFCADLGTNSEAEFVSGHSFDPAKWGHNETECWQVCNRSGCPYISNRTAHTYAENFTVDEEATCTEKGSKSKRCSRCDFKNEVTELPALGHDYGEWTVVRAATLDNFGEEKRVCSHDEEHVETRQTPKRVPQLVELGSDEVAEVVVSQPGGLDPDVELVVTEIEQDSYGEYSAVADSVNGEINGVYDVTLKSDGVAIQPDGTLTIKLRIPESLDGKPFKLFHIHGGEAVEKEYTVDDKYAVVTTDRLSEFVFVGDKAEAEPTKNKSNTVWLIFIIILAIIVACEIAYIVFRRISAKKKEGK